MRSCAPPRPCVRRPGFAPPAGACDAHCHVFGPAGRFPYHSERKYTPPDAPFESLRGLHAFLGFERAVLVQATCHGTDNRALLDALARSDGTCRGVAMVEPGIGRAALGHLDAAGVRGVRFSYARHISGAPRFEEVERMAALIAPLGWHLELYLEADDLVEHAAAIRALAVPVVIDHMARVDVSKGLDQEPFRVLLDLAAAETVWIKISCAERLSCTGPPYADVVPFARAVIAAAPGRVLWGTDWPHPNMNGRMPDDADLVDLLPALAPDEAARTRILVDNPARLYGFGG